MTEQHKSEIEFAKARQNVLDEMAAEDSERGQRARPQGKGDEDSEHGVLTSLQRLMRLLGSADAGAALRRGDLRREAGMPLALYPVLPEVGGVLLRQGLRQRHPADWPARGKALGPPFDNLLQLLQSGRG